MELPRVKLASSKWLPAGWQQPTTGLAAECRRYLVAGLASSAARHLRQPARDATARDLRSPVVQGGMQLLRDYTTPNGKAKLNLFCLAYTQLGVAARDNLRILAYQRGLPNLSRGSKATDIAMLTNPTYDPIMTSGAITMHEVSCSLPGVGVQIKRWKEIWLYVPGHRRQRLGGTDALILQRAIDALDGILPPDVALAQRAPLYYVPPEWDDTFFSDQFLFDWPIFPVDQYYAMREGTFMLADYIRHRK